MMRSGLATLLGLLTALARDPIPSNAEINEPGFRLELQTASISGKTVIEVRIRNEGSKAVMVNKRFAYAGLGNSIAELTFEGQPGPSLGCRFNVRLAGPTDYVLLDRGEFVGRSFDLTLLDCFVGHAPSVKLRAHYRDKSKPARSREVLTEELVSNEISITGSVSPRDRMLVGRSARNIGNRDRLRLHNQSPTMTAVDQPRYLRPKSSSRG